MASKHVPIRRCVTCGSRRAKRELVRVVHTSGGELVVDETGKRSGRGAYLCRNPECWGRAAKGSRLNQALRAEMTGDDRARLAAFGASLQEQAPAQGLSA